MPTYLNISYILVICLNLSYPAVSQNYTLTAVSPSNYTLLDVNSNPTVGSYCSGTFPWMNLDSRLVLPTPRSPTNMTITLQLYYTFDGSNVVCGNLIHGIMI